MTTRACRTCQWFDELEPEGYDPKVYPAQPAHGWSGLCRVAPPTFLQDGIPDGVWPTVWPHDWCGAWQDRREE